MLFRSDLRDAARVHLSSANKVAAATLFTTQSISADLHKIMRHIKHSIPAPASSSGVMRMGQCRSKALATSGFSIGFTLTPDGSRVASDDEDAAQAEFGKLGGVSAAPSVDDGMASVVRRLRTETDSNFTA